MDVQVGYEVRNRIGIDVRNDVDLQGGEVSKDRRGRGGKYAPKRIKTEEYERGNDKRVDVGCMCADKKTKDGVKKERTEQTGMLEATRK